MKLLRKNKVLFESLYKEKSFLFTLKNFLFKIIIYGFIFIGIFGFTISQNRDPNPMLRETIIESIQVNGKSLPKERMANIIIATNDSITFIFSCFVKGGERNDFLFRLILKNERDSSNRVFHQPVCSYKGLDEQNYSLYIQAFDPQGQWTATSAFVRFRVNNYEARLQSQLDSLRKAVAIKDSLEIIEKNKTAKGGMKTNDLLMIAGAVFGGISLFGIVFFIVKFVIKSKSKKNGSKTDKQSANMAEYQLTGKPDMDKLVVENSNLKAEISALRGQIDAMHARSGELRTQNKELQEKVNRIQTSKTELEELQKQKDELFAIIIHDIKNPASLIKSLVELLRSYDLSAIEQQEVIADIVETTSRIVSLSQEVSRILALEGNKLHLEFSNLNVNEIIRSVYHRNQVAADNKNIKFSANYGKNVPKSDMDPQKIEDVLDNLVSNAIKFTQNGGIVALSSKFENGVIIVDVKDNGLGLSQDDVKRAFQRGARLSAAPTAGEHSTGLGLWIVKKLVESHNGKVWVKSALGKGSTFSFSIPLNTDAFVNEPSDSSMEL